MAELGFVRDENGALCCGGRSVESLVEDARIGTPCYVYDLDGIAAAARSLVTALGPHGLCAYAVKANGAGPIVRRLVEQGCGIDVVSGGELRAALACGAPVDRIVYSGVAKRDDEIDLALGKRIKAIHAESVEELARIAARARALGVTATIGLRINPSVDAETHVYVATGHDEAKFGIAGGDLPRALESIRVSGGAVRLVGLSVHVGSQLTRDPYLAGVRALCDIATSVRGQGIALEYLDTGGGFGVQYRDEQSPPPPSSFVEPARNELIARGHGDLQMIIEPGRALVASYGVLVARVIQPKRSSAAGTERRWLLIDAGMNDLIRPALYQAHHRIEPMSRDASAHVVPWRVCGPVCESSDDFGEHPLPEPPPELVVIRDAGAYGRSMASAYNARPLAAEIFVHEGRVEAIRRAPSMEDVVREELGA